MTPIRLKSGSDNVEYEVTLQNANNKKKRKTHSEESPDQVSVNLNKNISEMDVHIMECRTICEEMVTVGKVARK